MRRALRAALLALTLAIVGPSTVFVAAPVEAQGKLIDINSATSQELDALPGIGPVRAAAIIKGRPYKRKDELYKRKIISESEYNKIKDRIIAHHKS
jgi:competence protein ComEA